MTIILLRVGPLVEAAAGPGYSVELRVDDPAGEAAAIEHVPKAEFDSVAADTADVLLGGWASNVELQKAGRALLDLLLRGRVAAAWTQLTEPASERRAERALLDVVPEVLRALPWELALSAGGPYLFVGGRPVMLRGGYPAGIGGPDELVVPITVLVVVGEPNDEQLHSDEEVDAILSALGSRHGEWHVEVVYAPRQEAFFQTLEQVRPHVLHFLGHSGIDPHSGDAGMEIQPDNPDDAWSLTGDLIDNVVEDAPRLVFLNACRTATESDASRNVAAVFAEHGTRGVVAMQGDIPSASSVAFTRTVYGALAAWQPIDVAVRLGRQALMKLQQPVRRDWALPTLTVAAPPERVLPICTRQPRAEVEKLFDPYLDIVRSFVDRSAKHRALWEALDPGIGPNALVVLNGDERAGKSSLTYSCLLTLSLQGRPVAYVDLDPELSGSTLQWLNVLCHIRDRVSNFLPERASEPRRAFDHALWYYRQGLDPDPTPGGSTPADHIWAPQSEHEPRLREAVYAAFLTFLEAVADGDPLVIALDHLRTLHAPPDVAHNAGLLLEPLASGHGRIRIVIVETTAQTERLLPAKLRDRATTVTVPLFTQREAIRVFREFGARHSLPFTGQWKHMALAMAAADAGPWEPSTLHVLGHIRRSGRPR